MIRAKQDLEKQIVSTLDNVCRYYTDPAIIKKALSKVPAYLRSRTEESPVINSDPEINLLLELLTWFKLSFFEWVDTPKCSICGESNTEMKGYSDNPEELIYTSRVEVYCCKDCGQRVLFPRYNNPAILLDNPRGRCGEWANTFTLICISMGFDARYVLDLTDHVWTEIYSNTEKRWIHCDPCEGMFDTPLMYEDGWGKQLTYVIAFSFEEVQDVTWRYTRFYDATLARRQLCSEKRLTALILRLNEARRKHIDPSWYRFILKRRLVELTQFLIPPVLKDKYGGRTSGSLSWRIQRNEYFVKSTDYVWVPNESHIVAKRFCMKYCTATDTYSNEGNKDIFHGWHNGVYECNSAFRKVETDWKMAYLCRNEESKKGSITWKFDMQSWINSYRISTVKIHYTSTSFNGGLIEWTVRSEDNTVVQMDALANYFETEDLSGKTWFTLTATMSQGCGNESWQSAQILRQKLNETECPLIIAVDLSSL